MDIIYYVFVNLTLCNLLIYSCVDPNSISKRIQVDCGLKYMTGLFKKRMPTERYRIVGGEESVPNAWPWQIDIRIRNNRHICGGSLITDSHVITSAHCIIPGQRYRLHAGVHNRSILGEYEQIRNISNVIIHPNFDEELQFDSDIAILKTKEPFLLNQYVNLVCLPLLPRSRFYGIMIAKNVSSLVGEKLEERNDIVLNQVRVPILKTDICNSSDYLSGLITTNMICAGYDGGTKDACGVIIVPFSHTIKKQGDSGSPLVCSFDKKNGF